MDEEHDGLGERLVEQAPFLRLTLAHLAGRAVRSRIEIEDLLQEVFLRALGARGLPAVDEGEASFRRFLARLARNVVIDAARSLRAAKREGKTLRLTQAGSNPDALRASALLARTRGPATRVAGHELQEDLRARFERLSPEHRRVIGLRQLEGLSAREAGLRMGRSETAIHSLYRRALVAWGADENPLSRDESA